MFILFSQQPEPFVLGRLHLILINKLMLYDVLALKNVLGLDELIMKLSDLLLFLCDNQFRRLMWNQQLVHIIELVESYLSHIVQHL